MIRLKFLIVKKIKILFQGLQAKRNGLDKLWETEKDRSEIILKSAYSQV